MVATAPAASITAQQLVACIPIPVFPHAPYVYTLYVFLCNIWVNQASRQQGWENLLVNRCYEDERKLYGLSVSCYLLTRITGVERHGESDITMMALCCRYRILPLVRTLVFYNVRNVLRMRRTGGTRINKIVKWSWYGFASKRIQEFLCYHIQTGCCACLLWLLP